MALVRLMGVPTTSDANKYTSCRYNCDNSNGMFARYNDGERTIGYEVGGGHMKAYSRRRFTAAGILETLGLTGCFNPANNRPEAVYGPPDDFKRSSSSSSTSSTSSSSSTSSASSPSSTSSSSSSASGNPDDYDPQGNEPETVYGPPEDFDPERNEIEDVYGPPEYFDPERNEIAPVYGPPHGAAARP